MAEGPYWLKGRNRQEAGDYLSRILLESLFYPLGLPSRRTQLSGLVIDEPAPALPGLEAQAEADPVLYWGCGASPGGLTPEQWRRTRVLSVRGPISASELRLGASVPQGDPALLLPALHCPAPALRARGKAVCIPDFLDGRSDRELLDMSGCGLLLRPGIRPDPEELRRFIDVIAGAEFVLSAVPHGAAIAARLQIPFGFWDDGRNRNDSGWADFAALIGVPAARQPNLEAAHGNYDSVMRPQLSLPAMHDSLAAAPLLPRPDALLKIIRAELANEPPEGMLERLDLWILAFERQSQHFENMVTGIIDREAQARDRVEAAKAAAVQAREEAAQMRRETAEARAAERQAHREIAEVREAAARARSEAAGALAAAEQARREAVDTLNSMEAMRRSSSWRVTRPLRAGGYIAQRHWGRALLEMGLPLAAVQRLAGLLGTRPAQEPLLLTADVPPVTLPWLSGGARSIYRLLKSGHGRARNPAVIGNEGKPRLAFVSPLPPDLTGIADYSAELLPELANYYDIVLIAAPDSLARKSCKGRYPVHDPLWLQQNADAFDRVLYHIGNSHFHREMLDLLEEVPGAAVLHDFFLGDLLASAKAAQFAPNRWVQALFQSHGYKAVADYYLNPRRRDVLFRYPVNHSILENAAGVIVHSECAKQLARSWYGEASAEALRVVPHLRKMAPDRDEAEMRLRLNLNADDFVVCSFGDVGPTKLNHRLLDAWFRSKLARDEKCVLVFVGQSFGDEYEARLLDRMQSEGGRVRFAGRVAVERYRYYLAAADLGVQLRARSRGESSGTVLDCMANGVPTIVNANGAMAELDPDAVWMLPDQFSDEALIEALETLWIDSAQRARLGMRAREAVAAKHDPAQCGRLIRDAIEIFHEQERRKTDAIRAYAANFPLPAPDEALRALALKLAPYFSKPPAARRIFLDITATAQADIKTGIERSARAITVALLKSPPGGYRIEPVYLSREDEEWRYRAAIGYTLKLSGLPSEGWRDELVVPHRDDILICLDISGGQFSAAADAGLFDHFRAVGAATYCLVHDLLPIQMPEYFPPRAASNHSKWLRAVTRMDGAICVSRSVSHALLAWLAEDGCGMTHPFKVAWSHHGADVENSAPSTGLPENAGRLLQRLESRPTFLMVGTVEPRKRHLQVLDAFTALWRAGHDLNLVIVGKEGWTDLPNQARAQILQTAGRLRSHPEAGKRLFWVEGASDEYLEKIYAAADCMIIASANEGFGLPVIEAARHNLPIIARDIEVFREVAGEHAHYFSGLSPAALAEAILPWLELYRTGEHPRSGEIAWLTWEQSARRLAQIILQDDFASILQPAAEAEPVP